MYNMPTNQEQYSELWEDESKQLDSAEIYKKLSEFTPYKNTIEIGCGIGIGTHFLSQGRNVLSLDNNKYLIKKTKVYLNNLKDSCRIHECDLFVLTEEDKKIIEQFKPNVIVGWFLGTDGLNLVQHTQEESDINSKGKLYREKIEDIIISKDICINSVDTIHLAIRATRATDTSDEEVCLSQKDNYDTYVFNSVGFEVTDVALIDWSRQGSNFQYGQAPNPLFTSGATAPVIISITAKRAVS